jgi:chorismate-pyruvate lyase
MVKPIPPGGSELGFDPLGDLLVAQSARPAHLAEINLRALTPFQRALLVIDGTVTKFIEAYTMEAVEVVPLAQSVRVLPADHVWLEAPSGAEVLTREVLLRGQQSRRIYAYALSLILPERLPGDFVKRMASGPKGIGGALLGTRLESYRDILWYGKERIQHLPDPIKHLENTDFISRTYRVLANGHPIMFINEKFPSGEDPMPSHH